MNDLGDGGTSTNMRRVVRIGSESNVGEHVTVLVLRIALVVYLWITSSRFLGGRTRASSQRDSNL